MQGLGIEDDDPVILLVRHYKIAATVPDNVGGALSVPASPKVDTFLSGV